MPKKRRVNNIRPFSLSTSCYIWLSTLCIFLAALSTSQAQITTNTALQIAEGQTVVRFQGRYLNLETGNAELDLWVTPLVTAYGVNSDFTIFGLIPFQFRNLETPTFNESTSGVGDLRLFARHYLYSQNKTGSMIRFAALGGLEFPTGETDITANENLLPRPLQPGMGSWNPFGGFVFTRHTLAWHFDASAIYTRNTEDNNFKSGDELLLSISNTYRVIPWEMKMTKGFFFGLFENNIRWSGNNQIDDDTIQKTGNFSWSILPGLQYIRKKLTVEAGVEIPVVEKSETTAFQRDIMVVISSRINF